jgi:hypothetical protein
MIGDTSIAPIPDVDRPEDNVISEAVRAAVLGRAIAAPFALFSGRDRRVVQELMGIDDLIVARSHGFDLWSRSDRTLEHEAGSDSEELIERVTGLVREQEPDLWLAGRVGIFVGRDAREVGGRRTSAWFALDSIEEVERFLDTLAR